MPKSQPEASTTPSSTHHPSLGAVTEERQSPQHSHFRGTLTFEEEDEDEGPLKAAETLSPTDPLTQFLQPLSTLYSTPPTPADTSIASPSSSMHFLSKSFLSQRRIVSIVLGLLLSLVVHVATVVEDNPLDYAEGSWQRSLAWALASDEGYINLHNWALLWPWITFEIAVQIYLLLSPTKKVPSPPSLILS